MTALGAQPTPSAEDRFLVIVFFSRQQELKADQLGIRDVAKAGYDPLWRRALPDPRLGGGAGCAPRSRALRVRGAIRLNGRVYRLIFAAQALSPAVDARFRASLESFRLINAADSALAEPQFLGIVSASGADSS